MPLSEKERIEQVMKEPAAVEQLTDFEARIRRNLLTVSSIVLFVTLLGFDPDLSNSSILGVKFKAVDESDMVAAWLGLLAILLYQFTFFAWIVKNKLQYWRVRLTGTRPKLNNAPEAQGYSVEGDTNDYPADQRQSNFYTWMLEQHHGHTALHELHQKAWIELEEYAQKLVDIESSTGSEPYRTATEILQKLNSIISSSDRNYERMNDIRFHASLIRFDDFYHCFVRSESLRWFVYDAGLPIILGLISIFQIVQELHSKFLIV